MKMHRKLLIALFLVGVAAAIAWTFRPVPIPVSTAHASRGPLQVTIEEDGQARIRERYVVTAPVTAYAARLSLHVGDTVRAGHVLLQLEPLPPTVLDARTRAEAEAGVAAARAALRAAETTAVAASTSSALATREQARLRPLFDVGTVTKTEYDRAASNAERAAAEFESARASVEVARQQLRGAQTTLRYAGGERHPAAEHVAVTAPISGRVLSVQHEDEGVVNSAQPLLTIGDPRSLEIVIDVLSADAVRIRPGMAVQLDRWGGNTPLRAHVRTVEPTAFTKISALGVEEQRVRVIADLESAPETFAALGDGYRVEARFVVWETASTLRIPHSSLFRSGDEWAVFAVNDGRAVQRKVQVGERGALQAEITEGLSDDEIVITYPDDRLKDGVRIEIREIENAGN